MTVSEFRPLSRPGTPSATGSPGPLSAPPWLLRSSALSSMNPCTSSTCGSARSRATRVAAIGGGLVPWVLATGVLPTTTASALEYAVVNRLSNALVVVSIST